VLKREGVLPPERIIRMMSQVAIGLDEAHARGFVHRDLKPDNLFLCGTREGDVVKLLDFGSAKVTATPSTKKLTVLGTTIGSPYYMAPEQAQGLETLDPRADIFALAAVTYECMTGQVPFIGTNGPSILLAILTKDPVPPSVKAANAKYPVAPAADEVIESALAKNPAIRTPTVGAFADALGHAYGLVGDHRQWARTPQQELAAVIAKATAERAARVPIAVVADPFAAPAPPIAAVPAPYEARYEAIRGMDEAFGATREADLVPEGVPSAKPQWLLPVIVGLLALVLGGAITLVVMMAR